MPNVALELPSGWTEQRDETLHGPAIVEYRHETEENTIFIVSVLPTTTDGKRFKLRLSTINPTSSHIHHSYLIDDYDSLEEALDEAEMFIKMFSKRLQKQYGMFRELEIARLLELPDIYQPQVGDLA